TVREPRELGEVRAHIARAERAVEADAEWLRVRNRHPEGVDRLSGQGATALVGDGDGDHQRQPDILFLALGPTPARRRARTAVLAYIQDRTSLTTFLIELFDRDDRGLGVERVEDRLEQQHIAAAVDEAANLLLERVLHLVERRSAERRIVHFRRN